MGKLLFRLSALSTLSILVAFAWLATTPITRDNVASRITLACNVTLFSVASLTSSAKASTSGDASGNRTSRCGCYQQAFVDMLGWADTVTYADMARRNALAYIGLGGGRGATRTLDPSDARQVQFAMRHAERQCFGR